MLVVGVAGFRGELFDRPAGRVSFRLAIFRRASADSMAASASFRARLAAFLACLKAFRACLCSTFKSFRCFFAACASRVAAFALAIRELTDTFPFFRAFDFFMMTNWVAPHQSGESRLKRNPPCSGPRRMCKSMNVKCYSHYSQVFTKEPEPQRELF